MRWTALLMVVLLFRPAMAEELPLSSLLQRAVLIEQDGSKVSALVARGVDLNDPIGCGTFAPLDAAVLNENVEMLKLLLSLGAKPQERQIVRAAFARDHEVALAMVKLLHAAGLSLNSREFQPELSDSTTVLHQAVWRENVELVRYLLADGDAALDGVDADGSTPLMIALENGNREIAAMLVAAGASERAGSESDTGTIAATAK